VGITQNANAREQFFLTALELSRLAEEAHKMAGSPTAARNEHHDLSVDARKTVKHKLADQVVELKDDNLHADCCSIKA